MIQHRIFAIESFANNDTIISVYRSCEQQYDITLIRTQRKILRFFSVFNTKNILRSIVTEFYNN